LEYAIAAEHRRFSAPTKRLRRRLSSARRRRREQCFRRYAASGRIIWDVDTKGSYQTVNETTAFGGSLDGPGPVVVDGMLYVTSGYAHLGGAPGNVLLAFSVGGK
jgi:hypothetical protein